MKVFGHTNFQIIFLIVAAKVFSFSIIFVVVAFAFLTCMYLVSSFLLCFMVSFFLFSDDKPIGCIFYNQELFEELGQRKEIGFDGTFYVVPDPFYQLWTGKI